MKILNLRIRKKKCKELCPLTLDLIPNIEKGTKEVKYNEKTEKAEIVYDESILFGKKIIEKLEKIGYHAKEC